MLKKTRSDHAPPLARWLLERMRFYESDYQSLGDLEEEYRRHLDMLGRKKANWFYWSQVILSIPGYIEFIMVGRFAMFKNYLKIALRNIRKRKVSSFVNITGLSIGMACCILLFLWIQDEVGFDRFHELTDRLYRVMTEGHYTERVVRFDETPAPLAPALLEDFPEIEKACRFTFIGPNMVAYGDKRFYEPGIAFADPSFFEIFSFPFAGEDAPSALDAISSVVITQEMADKYFDNENPIGKTMRFGNQIDMQVSAVLRDLPENSSIQFDFLLPIERYISMDGPTHWGGHSYFTCVLLTEGADYRDINVKMPEWTEAHTNEPVLYSFQALKDAYLYGTDGQGAITYVMIFSAIAVFVLLVACINFMNLATAKSGVRALEVGMRKVVGADRSSLIRQFFSESMLLTLIAFLFALGIVYITLPWFNHLSAKQLSFGLLGKNNIIAVLACIALFTGLLSGSYPAVFLSAFSPVRILKGLQKSGKDAVVRRVLVVFQLTLSIVLIVGSVVLYRQLIYIRNRNLGFDKEQMVCIQMRGDLNRRFESLKTALARHPGIPAVTAASGMPGGPYGSEWGQINWEGKDPDVVIPMRYLYIEDDFVETFGMEIVDGRNFSRTFSTDTLNVILNETAVQATGLEEPLDKRFYLLFRSGTVIGIVKDFHITSLRREIGPVILRMTHPRQWNYAFLRVNPSNSSMEDILTFVEETWKKFSPEYPFEYQFLDNRLDRLYRTEQRVGRIVLYFTCLTIFIACLGLFGLASFTAEQKTKEIGVRKVLGASVPGIVLMLSREFTRWVILASIIAWPVAYVVMNRWLRSFAYRIDLRLEIFVISTAIALVVTLFTVSTQSVRAAMANPADSLKYE